MFTWGGCLNSWCNQVATSDESDVLHGLARLLRLTWCARSTPNTGVTPPGERWLPAQHTFVNASCLNWDRRLREELHIALHTHGAWLAGTGRKVQPTFSRFSKLTGWFPVCDHITGGKESHGSLHRDRSWLLSSKVPSRYRVPVASCWNGSHSKS